MSRRACIAIMSLAWIALAPVSSGAADDVDRLPPSVTFVVSTGYWEQQDIEKDADPASGAATASPEAGAKTDGYSHGYYKLVSVRQPDRTAKVYLQQVAANDDGPEVISSVEVDDINAMRPFVTDIRPETSTGISNQPGLFATIYLKTDPGALEAESWTVLIDDLGELTVEKATN